MSTEPYDAATVTAAYFAMINRVTLAETETAAWGELVDALITAEAEQSMAGVRAVVERFNEWRRTLDAARSGEAGVNTMGVNIPAASAAPEGREPAGAGTALAPASLPFHDGGRGVNVETHNIRVDYREPVTAAPDLETSAGTGEGNIIFPTFRNPSFSD